MHLFTLHLIFLLCFSLLHCEIVRKRSNRSTAASDQGFEDSFHAETISNDNKSAWQVRKREPRLQCQMTIEPDSQKYLTYWLRKRNGNIAYLKIRFNMSVLSMPDTFLPNNYIFTYRSRNKMSTNLEWPYDYGLLSLNILNHYALYGVDVYMRVTPPSCPIILGETRTDFTVADALWNFTLHDISPWNDAFNHSVFCYRILKRNHTELAPIFWLSLRFADDFIEYRCCGTKYHRGNYKLSCNQPIISTENVYVKVPYFVALLIFIFVFPLFLTSISDTFTIKSTDPPSLCGYEPFWNETNEWIFLGEPSPVTISGVVRRVFFFTKYAPILCSRIQRIFALLGLPCVMYLRLYWYSRVYGHYIVSAMSYNIPVGDLAIPYGYQKSKHNWNGFLGGPYVIYGAYFVIGFILLCGPRDILEVLSPGTSRKSPPFRSILNLDVYQVSKLSRIDCISVNGFRRMHNVMKANFYILLNSEYWVFAAGLLLERGEHLYRVLKSMLSPRVCRPCMWLTIVSICIVYSILSCAEIVFATVYYACPITSLTINTINGFISNVLTCDKFQVHNCKYVTIVLKAVICLILLVVFLFEFYILFTIMVTSFRFIVSILLFSYIGLIVYPNISSGYFIAFCTSIYYIWKCSQTFNDKYTELFSNLVDISEKIATASAIDNKIIFVRYFKQFPGIPKRLYLTVVDKELPIFRELFTAFVDMALKTIFIYGTIFIVMRFELFDNITPIMQVISGVIIGFAPRIVHLVKSGKTDAIKREAFKRHLEYLILEYNNEK